MAAVREFMVTYLDNKYAKGLKIQTNWKFRVNRSQEKNANDVVDLSCMINGETTIDQVIGVLKGNWLSGQTVDVNFKWPSIRPGFNPRQPVLDAGQSDMVVKGPLASFAYKGEWALLRMIQNHLVKGSLSQDNSYLLRFEIPTSDDKKTVIFNSIKLLTPTKNTKNPGKVLKIPSFPDSAPPMPQTIIAEKGNPILTRKTLTYNLDSKKQSPVKIKKKSKKIFVDVSPSDGKKSKEDSLFKDAS